jgi:hypothetical protein
MTAVGLLDLLARQRDASTGQCLHDTDSLAHLAGELVSSSLMDFERLTRYEREFVSECRGSADHELDLRRSIWELFQDWLADAAEIYDRVPLLSKSVPGSQLGQLSDAIGFVRARLSVKPEQTATAVTQAREGQFIPAKELRDELHARLRS